VCITNIGPSREDQRQPRRNQIRELTQQQLFELTDTDLKLLEEFANRRMDWLPRARVSAEDIVQKALLSIIRGATPGAKGRLPQCLSVITKDAFMHYVRSVINSVIDATKRKRELLFIHETINRDQDSDSQEQVVILTSITSPDADPALVDLRTELFSRLRDIAPARLQPTLAEWENTFFWSTHVPSLGKRQHQEEVRRLAVRILRKIARDLAS
jgi:hypothetical protein